MSALLLRARTPTFRRLVLTTTSSLTLFSLGSASLLHPQQRLHLDTLAAPRSPFSTSPIAQQQQQGNQRERLDPETLRQISGGSVAGFVVGLLIGVFSRTLVLLLGVGVVAVQVAARYGINLVDQLRVRKRLEESRVLTALQKNPAFKISFGFFFAMSAFMKF